MIKDYLQDALQTFNNGAWYGWKKYDDDGSKITNNQRMCYECIAIIKDGATMPRQDEVEEKKNQLNEAETKTKNKKETDKQKKKE